MKTFIHTHTGSKSKQLGLALCLTLVGLAFSQVAFGQVTTKLDTYILNDDRSQHTTSYQMHRGNHVWNMTNEGNGKFYLHYTPGANPVFGNRINFFEFSRTQMVNFTGRFQIIQRGIYSTEASFILRGKNVDGNNRFIIAQQGSGDAVLFNDHANGEMVFGTKGSTRMTILPNGNIGIRDKTPGRELTVVGVIRGAKETSETNYLELSHNGTNSFVNHLGAGNMDFRFNSSTLMQVAPNGRLGIGGDFDPTATLEVRGTGIITGDVSLGGAVNTTGVFTASGTSQFNDAVTVSGPLVSAGTTSITGDLTASGVSTFTNAVTIGAQSANHNLEVYGRAKVMELEIKPNGNWADFVFADDYALRPLSEVAEYIAEHKHLPEVPTTEEVSENGYLQTDINATLLQKIEELTLYMIELKADNEELREEVAELKATQADRR